MSGSSAIPTLLTTSVYLGISESGNFAPMDLLSFVSSLAIPISQMRPVKTPDADRTLNPPDLKLTILHCILGYKVYPRLP